MVSTIPAEAVELGPSSGAGPSSGDGHGLLDARMAGAPSWRVWLAQHERPFLGVIGFVGVLVVWEIAVRAGLLRAVFFSSPTAIANTAITLVSRGTIWRDIGVSMQEFALGYLGASVLGILLGIAAGWYRRVNALASPWIAAWYATPHIALIPLIVLWFGIGLWYKVFYVFLVAFFSVVINTLVGVQSAEAAYLDVAKSFRASQWTILRTVVLPGAVPYILTGLRLGAGRAWVGVVVSELVGANQGIGFMINLAGQMLNMSQAMLGIVLLGTFGIAIGEVMRRIERRFDVWRPQRADR
jgi:NitT/TauT family transport system permease protein